MNKLNKALVNFRKCSVRFYKRKKKTAATELQLVSVCGQSEGGGDRLSLSGRPGAARSVQRLDKDNQTMHNSSVQTQAE